MTTSTTPQKKARDRVLIDDSELLSAAELGERIARICFGMYNWQGCKEVIFPYGYSRLANRWLKASGMASASARVGEEYLERGDSRYFPYWLNK
jgi:hypothetical protein